MEIKDIVVDAQEVRGGNNDFAAFGNVVGFNTGSANTINKIYNNFLIFFCFL